MNEAPFQIGQRVVAISTDRYNAFRKKGNEYFVLRMFKCPRCGRWSIDIGEKDDGDSLSICSCKDLQPSNGAIWHFASAFAPIQEKPEKIKYVAVSETLREKAIEIAAIETN